MDKIKPLTVGELIKVLRNYDQNLLVAVYREGKGHGYPVTDEGMRIEMEGLYYPDNEIEDGDQPTLIIGTT